MIEGDLNDMKKEQRNSTHYRTLDETESLQGTPTINQDWYRANIFVGNRKIIYENFHSGYWPHLPQHLTKGFGRSSG
jgi:hypothetical protein